MLLIRLETRNLGPMVRIYNDVELIIRLSENNGRRANKSVFGRSTSFGSRTANRGQFCVRRNNGYSSPHRSPTLRHRPRRLRSARLAQEAEGASGRLAMHWTGALITIARINKTSQSRRRRCYKIGAALVSRERGPDRVPHPPTPRRPVGTRNAALPSCHG